MLNPFLAGYSSNFSEKQKKVNFSHAQHTHYLFLYHAAVASLSASVYISDKVSFILWGRLPGNRVRMAAEGSDYGK